MSKQKETFYAVFCKQSEEGVLSISTDEELEKRKLAVLVDNNILNGDLYVAEVKNLKSSYVLPDIECLKGVV